MITIEPHSSEKIYHHVSKKELVKRLRTFLPAQSVLTEQEQLSIFESDALSAYRCLPWLVVLPETLEQVQRILRICHELNVPVVPRGAGTGLAGGAIPLANGVLLCMTKFNQILHIDPDNRLAVVQPGVRNLQVSQAVSEWGLYYAPDPSSQIACTIGGNVAENSGGVHCLKYGLTTHNILSVQFLTMEGELLTLGSHAYDAPGYDLLSVFTGSEGLLGVVTQITVRLLPKPADAKLVMAAFNRIENAAEAVSAIIASGLIPAGLEMMDKAAVRAVEQFLHAGYPHEAEAVLLAELDGSHEQVEEETGRICHLFEQWDATYIQVAHTESERQLLWLGRKSAFPAVGRISPDYYCMDGTIPRRHLAEVLQGIQVLSEQYGLAVANVFHAGDGNLHPLILYNADHQGELMRAEKLGADILRLCLKMGGTITGEHGVGVEKINQMCEQFNSDTLTVFHGLKSVFDPKGLLNPGKTIPSLHRCAELGAMHVHQGQVAFPNLDRF